MLIPKLGIIDDLYAYLENKVTARRAESRFFSKGWGNHAAIGEVQRKIFSGTPPVDIEVRWENEWRPHRGHYARDGLFETSHFRAYLPEESRTCYFRIISPEPELRCPVYVHMAASGEEGYAAREASIAVPLLARGCGSLIVEHPYLGRRRPAAQRSTRPNHVSDLLLLGGTAIEEARSILQWLYRRGHPRLGITGVSMGGHLAALAGVLTAFDLAIVPYVAPHSAVPVFTEGLIKKACDWEKLAGNDIHKEFAEQKLRKYLQCTAIDQFPLPRNQAVVIAIAARDDRFVPAHSVEAPSRHWPNAELRCIEGGHVSSILGQQNSHLAALVDAMDMLGEVQKKTARPAA